MEKTYLIFRANCVRNPNMTGDLEFCQKYRYPCGNSYLHPEIKHSLPYNNNHPALKLENILVTDSRRFKPNNQCKDGISSDETVLMICEEDDDYQITLTYYDKSLVVSNHADKWITEDLDTAAEWGLTDQQVKNIKKKLISFYEDFFEMKQRLELKTEAIISYLSNKYLVEIW